MADNLDVHIEAEIIVKQYAKPAIVHELKLETRAGSPLRHDPLLDPLGIDPTFE